MNQPTLLQQCQMLAAPSGQLTLLGPFELEVGCLQQ